MRGRIKVGAFIRQDFNGWIWPRCFGPNGKLGTNPDTVFELTLQQDGKVKATAPGFGDMKNGYGNGSLYVISGPPTTSEVK